MIGTCDIHGSTTPIGGICNFCIAEEEERIRQRVRDDSLRTALRDVALTAMVDQLKELRQDVLAVQRAVYMLAATTSLTVGGRQLSIPQTVVIAQEMQAQAEIGRRP